MNPLETVFRHIEESAKGSASEGSFAGLFDDFDVNSNKLGATVAKRNERLVKLLNGVAAMNLGDVKGHEIDAFGDAYEYLMTMYASNAGKSGGEFFTPADVSALLTRLGTVGKTESNKVYDPACGSGSLLLKAEKVLGREAIRNGFFGQEINITTYNLFYQQKLKLVQGTKVMEVSPDKLKKVKLPVPPMEVQREIVRILDQFTELTAELIARKKQYEYYRDKVLTFDNSFPVVALSGLCDIGDGLHGTPTYDNNGEYYFINGNNLSKRKIVFDAKTKKIQQIEYEKIKIQFGQTLLFSINGTIGKIAIYNDEKLH